MTHSVLIVGAGAGLSASLALQRADLGSKTQKLHLR